jgi:hypothetical protein
MDSINILGINYTIEYYDKDVQHDGSLGASNSRLGLIRICRDMPEDVQKSTILHEVLHQISEKNGLNLSEAQILCLERGLFSIINFKQ